MKRKVQLILLIKAAFSVMRIDKIIIVPYIIFSIFAFHYQKLFPTIATTELISSSFNFDFSFIFFLVMIWLIELIVKGITILMTLAIIKKQAIHILVVIHRMKCFFWHLFFGSICILIPIYGVFLLFQMCLSMKLKFIMVISVFLGLTALFFLTIVSEILPIVVILHSQKWYIAIKQTVHLIKKNFIDILIYMSFIMAVGYMSILGSFILRSIPLVGKVVLPSIWQGMVQSFLVVMLVVFFQAITVDASGVIVDEKR